MSTPYITFDVDAHVEESVDTWKHLDEKFDRRRPIPVTLEGQPALLGQNAFWLIDGAVVPRTAGERTVALRHADQLAPCPRKALRHRQSRIDRRRGEDCMTWIASVSKRKSSTRRCSTPRYRRISNLSTLLCRAYNTWIAEACAQSHGRLRWNAMLRLTHIPECHRRVAPGCRPRCCGCGDPRYGR